MEIVLEAGHSHFYPGLEGWLDGETRPPPAGGSRLPSRIAFADGAMAGGTLSNRSDGQWELEVDPYRTAAGTDIAAKRWQVSFRSVAGGRTRFRIEKKLAPRQN
jgi:hypothetical protein